MSNAKLKLVQAFDEETALELDSEKQKQDCDESTVVLDFSSNWNAMETCMKSAMMCLRIYAATEANPNIPAEEKAEKLAVLREGFEKFKNGWIAHSAAHDEELKSAA